MSTQTALPDRCGHADGRAATLAQRVAAATSALRTSDLPPEVLAKVRTCLLDFIGCAFESADLPTSRQARAAVTPVAAGAPLAASRLQAGPAEAAFVNAVMGHGLVREDMHSASISHLGVAVLPAVLALASVRPASGADLVAGIVAGYEVGACIGAALMDADLARRFRPTGITGPIAGAAACARLLRLDADRTAHALSLAANGCGGLNAWGHAGGGEMYFHPGLAARNAVTCALLAEAGAFGSPGALDGEGGLFQAYGKPQAASRVRPFEGAAQILAVYHKPVPACNFAQSASLAAVELARSGRCPPGRIERVEVRVPLAGARYPGCDFTGPFDRALQAKMSIQYNVAAALLTGDVAEANFTLLQDAALLALVRRVALRPDDALTRAYPARQGSTVEVLLDDGSAQAVHLDDVVHASDEQVRERFRLATSCLAGEGHARAIESLVDALEASPDAGALARALALPAANEKETP